MTLDELLYAPQFSMLQERKEQVLLDRLNELTRLHYARCVSYQRVVDAMFPASVACGLAGVPYLPVGLFKSHLLSSVPESEVFRVLQSSGTSGQQPSRIPLDKKTAALQATALSRIMIHVLGDQRLPMLIVDNPDVLRNKANPGARAAAVLGMMNFGRSHTWLLNERLELEPGVLAEFLRQFGGTPFLIFGFTFLVWSQLYQTLSSNGFDLSNGILVHGGGWKKLQQIAVTNPEFKAKLASSFGLRRVFNFYGMAEQTGSVFLEGDDGLLYAPNFADVIVRDPDTWASLPNGKLGVVQVLSLLPFSYPGHSILTEDLGAVETVDSGIGGRFGKAFRIVGRMERAELRGCSDVLTENAA